MHTLKQTDAFALPIKKCAFVPIGERIILVRKTKQEALETRTLILDAAERIFHEQGVAHTSLNEIADAAGVTRGAIYWHFKNKVDLFNCMHARVHLPIEALAEVSAKADETDPLGRLRDLLVLVLVDTVENQRQQRVLEILIHKCEFICEMGDLVQRQQAIYQEACQRTQRSLINAVNRGQLPADLDTRKASVAVHGYIRGLLSNWLFMKDMFDLSKEAPALIDALVNMLRTAPSLQLADNPDIKKT